MAETITEDFIHNDPVVKTWTAVECAGGAGTVIAIYLLLVKKILPAFMMDRKPFAVKRLLLAYNSFQVVFSAYMVYIYAAYMWRNGIFPTVCPQINPNLLPAVANDILPYYIAKHLDLLDTVFFVLRKKDKQVSFLHLYHHSVMITWSWFYYMYLPTDHFVVPGFLNSFVHVLMYTYYGISSLGPEYAKYVWWKKHLTKVQLVQFVLCVINQYYQQKITPCPIPKSFYVFAVLTCLSFLVLFMNFYIKAYRNKKNSKKMS